MMTERNNNLPTEIVWLDQNSDLSKFSQQNIEFKKNSMVNYIFVVTENIGQDLLSEINIQVGSGATANVYYCFLGKYNITINLSYHIAERVKLHHQVLFMADHQQVFSFNEKYIFEGSGSFGRFFIKGLVKNESKASANSNIIIDSKAQHTDAYLDMQAAIMDKLARAHMIPGLQISANNVKASHSAKVSALDESQIFYLRSRGLTVEQARLLYLNGLFGEMVKNIPDEQVQLKINELILHKLNV